MATVTQAQEILFKANALIDEVERIIVSGSAEEKGKIQEMMQDAEKMKAEAIYLKNIDQYRDELKTAASGITGGSTRKGSDFTDFGEYLRAVSAAMQYAPDKRLVKFRDASEAAAEGPNKSNVKDMTGQTGSGGGFLIPTENEAQMLAIAHENSIIRQRATRLPMTRRQLQIPVLDQTATTAGIPHWFGGMRAYWTEEASAKTASDATFRQVVLTAWKLVMFTRASDELLEDSAISLAAFLSSNMGFAGAIQWMEDYAFLQGTGVGQPLGIVNAPCTLSGTRAGANTVTYPDLTGMMRRFLPTGKGVWIISQSAMAQLLELAGPSGNPSYLWGSAVNGAPSSLLGLPVIWTEKLPALGTAGDVLLIDPTYYLVGDRQMTTIESTKFERWEYDVTSWRAVHRVDGQPWLSTHLTYADGTTQVSPFVRLAA